MPIDRNFCLWFSFESVVRKVQLKPLNEKAETPSLLLEALFPEFDEFKFLNWLATQITKGNDLECFLLQKDFENAIRHCRDPNLAAVISALSCTTFSNHPHELVQKQLRKWQQDGTVFNAAWRIIAADDSHHKGIEAFAIRLHYKYESVQGFRQRLSLALKSCNEGSFWESIIRYALGEYSGTLNDLLALLESPKARLEVAIKLRVEENVIHLLNSQIQESSVDNTSLQSLINNKRFAEAGDYLSVSYLSIPQAQLFSYLEQLGELIVNYPKLHLLQLYHQKPPGHEALMKSIINNDSSYLPREQELRQEMTQYLASNFGLLPQNDLSPDFRLRFLHQKTPIL